MEISNLIPHIEALIFASDKPLTSAEITDLINSAFGFMEDKIVPEQIDAALEGIVEKYNSEFYPFEVRQSGGGWQFLTKKDYHKTVAQLNGEKFLKRLSAAALETLAIIAYKQPITKGEIEAIRGVSSDYSVQKLLEKELIVISGRNEKLPGHPLVYSTSKNFMDYFGLNSPEDLPRIKEVLADQIIEPTVVNHTEFDQSETLIVSEEGELLEANGEPTGTTETTTDAEAAPAEPTATNEPHINGHAFEIEIIDDDEDEEEDDDNESEDETAEEAMEDYISDTEFVKGDEEEEIRDLSAEGDLPSDTDEDAPEDADTDSTDEEKKD
jgi:segregation and condensation protein B